MASPSFPNLWSGWSLPEFLVLPGGTLSLALTMVLLAALIPVLRVSRQWP